MVLLQGRARYRRRGNLAAAGVKLLYLAGVVGRTPGSGECQNGSGFDVFRHILSARTEQCFSAVAKI